ncbi:MAG: FecR family protein [Bacteroidetes bacterium]|nr:FecR family protein [Bacteroidota bacterium]
MEKDFTPNEHWQFKIAEFLKGELSLDEERLLQDWINKDIKHLHYFEEYRNLWLGSVTFGLYETDAGQKWEMFNFRLNQQFNKSTANNSNLFFIPSMKRIAYIAAVLIVGMVTGILVYTLLINTNNKNSDEICEMVTPLGAKSQILLPDGTMVWLNAGSKLSYKKSFNNKDRMVSLEGEAFFKVKSNKRKPFVVQTSRLNVKALGTTFNVKAYPEDKSVTAILIEGVIQVNGSTASSRSFNFTLKPSQSITVDENHVCSAGTKIEEPKRSKGEPVPAIKALASEGVLINSIPNTEKYTSWKDSHWIIEAENLENLAVLFGRKYNVDIHIKSENLKQYRFTGTIRNETLEQVLEILKLTTPLKYKVGKGEVFWDIDTGLQKDFSRIMVKKK